MSLKSTTSPDSLVPTSPFSNYSNLSTSSISNHSNNASPNFKSSTTPHKEKKSAIKHQTQLSTSSPAGIAVANKVTPERLAHLLLKTGPLAIRHITSNLAKQIQGFEKLSLSKQRRLIMSSLDQGYQEESIIFEKIGWGQWSAKKIQPENFIKERNAIRIANAKVKDGEHNNSVNNSVAANARRESITKNKYEVDHHEKFLKKHASNSTLTSRTSGRTINPTAIDDDYAIVSDDEDEDEDEDEEDEGLENSASSTSDFYDDEDDAENGVFKFDDEEHIPPLKLNSRLVSPPIQTRNSARSSFSRGISKPKFKSVRSNSQTPTSPELLYYQRMEKSSKNSTAINRRHSSIRSTLNNDPNDNNSDTDEEDWQSIGALKLRKNSVAPPEISIPHLQKDEQDAAFALVNLRSI